ncbi:protease modulator HflC [Lachnoclostridium sp. Marseille-P6806]|uniref:protease modulator HflC n=1 Tax=Lachnoclostridium sp. Marseille-P6806 TaxID=2364793 RepID=UPI00102FABBA|nr:protease modulator HflC [Lachnoclostridium sp. Marseille-P6806]
MKKKWLVILPLLAAAVVVAVSSCYTVTQKQYVAVRQFGRIVRVETTPGLKIKLPFVQSTQAISAAVHLYDIPESDVITKDKKSMIADDYVLWRVSDPVRYVQTLNALDARAQERIEAAVYNATKEVISSMTQDEVIEARGERMTSLITKDANDNMSEYGIEITQAAIKALDLPDDNKEAVYERMISERQNIAASYEAEGESEAQKIRNQTDREVAVMKAEATKQADITVAEGEAEYMNILADAYNDADKAEFYNFVRSLDALKASLAGGNKTILLDKDSDIAQMFYGIGGEKGKTQP